MRRILGVLMVVLATILLAWTILVGPWPVENVSPTSEPAYRSTLSRLAGRAAALPEPVAAPLSAGWSRVPITPAVPTNTAGYGKVTARRVNDSVYVRALALRVDTSEAILIGADILIVSRQMSDRVRSALAYSLGIAGGHVYFTATHTHSGPGNWSPDFLGKQFAGRYDPARLDTIVAAMSRAAHEAHAALAPAEMAYGSFSAPSYVRNRLLGTATHVDSTFVWAAFRHRDGGMAVWGRFSAHATTIGDRAAMISGDYPGVWERELEARTAEVALFSAGAVGSMSPRGSRHDYERAQAVGMPLADSVRAHVARAPWSSTVRLLAYRLPMDLPPNQMRLQRILASGKWRISPLLAGRLVPIRSTALSVLALNRLVLAGMPCDLSGELSREIAASAEARGFLLATTSFGGDYIGYVLPDRHDRIDNYETRTMSWWGPHMGSFLADVARRSIAVAMDRIAAAETTPAEPTSSPAAER